MHNDTASSHSAYRFDCNFFLFLSKVHFDKFKNASKIKRTTIIQQQLRNAKRRNQTGREGRKQRKDDDDDDDQQQQQQ